MPALIANQLFKDIFNQSLSFYQSNAGDTQTFTCNIFERIQFVSSPSLLFNLTQSTNTINIIGGNFLTEGFRAGDIVQISAYNSNGNLNGSNTLTITAISASFIILSGAVTHWHDPSNGEYVIITVVYSKTEDKRNGLWLDVNLTQNGATGNEFSLIDSEVTRFTFNLTGTILNQTVNGVQTGLKSGQFNVVATLKDKTNYPNTQRNYEVTVGFINSGVYNSSNFDFSNCLKLYLGFNWQRVYNDPNNMYKYVFNDDANTGWFDEAFNVGTINATLVQGISSIDYSQVNTGQISIDSASTSFGFGACYIPTDENYFKTQPQSQSALGMLCPSQTGTAPITIVSSVNPSGAGYTIEFSNPVTVGTITTWNWEFTPNSQFTTFMDGQADGDRLFYIWAKYGNVNLLLFKDQLTKPVAQGDPLNMVTHNFVDHSQNITNNTLTKNGFSGNVEDDIAFIGKFLVENDSDIEYVKGEIYAVNSVSNEEFLLSSVYFDFTSVPKVSGKYPINQSIEVITTLPNTSEKLRAILIRDNSIDTLTEYGFRIYVPFFYKWEYWLSQPNADADFYPNEQTQNWTPYGNTTDWNLVFRVTANIESLDSKFEDTLAIKDYDSDPNLTNQITLFKDSPLVPVNVIVEGDLHRVEGRHVLTTGTWDQPNVWGMITIEPTESNPRWICSTVVPFDNDLNNPLSPITGLYATLTFPAPNVARITCYFDPNKINLQNGVKFTSKIKGCNV
jgi:hypothetical protein